jgi:uncharacterized protein DUF1207
MGNRHPGRGLQHVQCGVFIDRPPERRLYRRASHQLPDRPVLRLPPLASPDSHLGDEFILNSQPPVNRINLSFEEHDMKLSYELFAWLRVYGGGGMLVDQYPKDLKGGTSQMGTELTSPWTLWGGKVRPVAYADFQANARSNWRGASSVKAGLQFENVRIGDRKLQVLAEYFSGPSPNGQFYTQATEWFGLGVHLYY